MDSFNVVSLIHHSNYDKHPYSTLILKIKQLIDRNWAFRVGHVYGAADFMASTGHALVLDLHVYCDR